MTRLLALLNDPVQRARLLRFAGVSVVSTATTTVVITLMLDVVGLSDLAATTVATMTGALPAFELSRRWVWSHSDRTKVARQAAIFWPLAFARMLVALAAVKGISLVADHWSKGPQTLAVAGATIGAYGVLWLVQFGILDRFLFRARRTRVPGPSLDATVELERA